MLRRLKTERGQEARPAAPTPSAQAPTGEKAPAPQQPGNPSAAPRDLNVKNPDSRLGDILLEGKVVTKNQLDEGLAKQKKDGGFLGQALIELGYLDQDTLTLVLVKQCKIPHLNLLDYSISPDMKDFMPVDLCEKHKVLPIDKMGKILTVAMVDPLNSAALEAVRSAYPELRIKPILCDWPHFQEVFGRFAQKDQTSAGMAQPYGKVEEHEPEASAPEVETEQEPAASSPAAATKSASATGATVQTARLEADYTQAAGVDIDAIKSAIADGMKESLSLLEQRVSEATELLHRAQQIEREVVATQQQRDLGAEPKAAPRPRPGNSSVEVFGESAVGGELTFENFVVGEANRAVVDLARSVLEKPGAESNPLFVCGDVGLGKTHVLCAIGNALKVKNADLRVGFTSASRFVDDAMAARSTNGHEAFRQMFESLDAIVLDDVQFLGGRVEPQEDLFHIFNSMLDQHKQIVLAGDRSPEKLGLLEKRLVSRFDSGIVAHIHAPEWETRVEILRNCAKKMNIQAPDDVIAMIAMRHANDVRRLIGSLRKVAAHAKSNGGTLTAEIASQVLADVAAEVAA